jgi:hypothetical protein
MKIIGANDIEMYISQSGYLVIKAECTEYGRVNTFLFTPDQTKLFYQHLPRLMQIQEDAWTGIDLDDER